MKLPDRRDPVVQAVQLIGWAIVATVLLAIGLAHVLAWLE